MSWLKYGNDPDAGTQLGEAYHYSQYVHLPNGITKFSGQGGWHTDLDITAEGPWKGVDPKDWKGQIDRTFDNIEINLKHAGFSGLDDIFLIRSYLIDPPNHFPYLIEVMKKRLGHRPVYTALSVPALGSPDMIVEIEVEAYRK